MIVGLHVALDKGSHLHKILDTACCFVISRRFLGGPTPPLQLG